MLYANATDRAYVHFIIYICCVEWFYKMFTSNLNYIKVMKEKLNAKELQMISDQDNVYRKLLIFPLVRG